MMLLVSVGEWRFLMNRIRVGIIGTGNMGKNHVRLVREMVNQFEFIGVYDPDRERIQLMGLDEYAFNSIEELADAADALIIAAPSSLHKEIALVAAKKEKHLLIEKPLALSYEDGKQITNEFSNLDRVLMVGHVERFNPVVLELEEIIKNEDVVAIEIDRCSPMDKRISDTDVVYDLMIHDVDILINALNPHTEISEITAYGSKVYSRDYADYVQAIMRFKNNVIASVVSSRTSESKIRKIIVHCKDSFIEADLLNKALTVSRKTKYTLDVGYTPTYRQENIIERVFVPNEEPLRAELQHFYQCIANNEPSKTDGDKALNSIRVLDVVKNSIY